MTFKNFFDENNIKISLLTNDDAKNALYHKRLFQSLKMATDDFRFLYNEIKENLDRELTEEEIMFLLKANDFINANKRRIQLGS